MNTETAMRVIEAGRSSGADFVELFEEETHSSVLSLKGKEIDDASAGTDFGIGIRLLFGTEVLYAFTSEESPDSLIALVRKLALGRTGGLNAASLSFSPKSGTNLTPDFKDSRILGQSYKLDFLKTADSAARALDSKIIQVSASVFDEVSHISIINSEGLWINDERARVRLSVNVTASDGTERIVAREAPGALGGYEVIDRYSAAELAVSAGERALRMLGAGYVTGGQMPVVMGNGFGGVIFHEACGHPLETEAIRHKASPFCDKLGEKVAHSCVTAVDDGTLPGVWGSIQVDDEGMPAKRTTLIENGILKSYMSDRVGATELGLPRTGNARRESYKYAPVSRMTNTFIAPGNDTLDAMISSTEHGLYAAKMAGGSVNPATGEFNFAVEEGYLIRNGKIAEPVRGATLIGKGHEILPRISMVGSDFETAAGMCGASSGSIPVTVGQPSIKVDKILVGGR
ncbi:MAG: TldD/PmbA family protein [Fibrobacter sp.]|jgi:TldD protein|nr:TldD/PmbA family protein [Fibrobacter sp.]